MTSSRSTTTASRRRSTAAAATTGSRSPRSSSRSARCRRSGSGDDSFTVRAFALLGSTAIDPNQHTTGIFGGLGNDFVQYTDNAPISIDGGAGTDTVVVIGTEFGDVFVITPIGVFGAGLFIQLVGIEILKVDAQEGNDRFVVYGTAPGASTSLFGNLGSDTFEIGGAVDGQAVATAARDLLGHSGLILHSIAPGSVATYGTVVVNGVSTSVADNDASAVVVTPTSSMTVYENRPGFTTATYTVVLSRAPVGGNVFINVSPTELTADELAAGALPLGFLDSSGNVVGALVLTFTAANWFLPQTVTVVVQNDGDPSGNERQVPETFTLAAGATTGDFTLSSAPLRLERLTVNGQRIRSSEATLLADGRTVRLTSRRRR